MRVTYDLPNPFMRLSVPANHGTDREAAALEPDEPPFRGGAAAEPVGFVLDEATFMSDIEPAPAFLTDNRAAEIEELLKIALAEDWPAPPVLRRANG
jgi:hypothetical protein